jgi:branched-chain amino acid transport system permease protein
MKSIPTLVATLALAALLAALPLWSSPYHISLFVTVFMYAVLAGSWNLFCGMTGYVSLGHGLFFGIGAYSFAIATAVLNLPPAFGLVLGIVVPGLIAFVLGLVLLTTRIRIAYFAVVMLGLNEITKTIVANVKSIGSSYGLTLPSLPNRFVAYYVLLGLALAVTGFAYCIQRTRWGYGLKAILADEVAAEMTGVDTVAHKLWMFVASAIFIGMAGAMIAWNWSYVDPYMAFDLGISFDMVVMAMFGGFGTVVGPVLGAVVMSIVKELLSTSLPHFHPIIFGVLVIVLIIWCPGGIIQAVEVLRAKLKSWARPGTSGALR